MRASLLVVAASVLSCCGGTPPARPPASVPAPAPAPPVPPAPPVADPAPPAFRLPGDVRPTRGDLELTIVPDREQFDGIARYAVDVVRPTAMVWLNATGLDVTSATVGGASARVVPGGDDFVGLAPAAPLAPGPTTIEVRYRAQIDRERTVGVYATQDGGDWYAYSQFEPLDARRAFPCFDEPSFKIPWTVHLHVRRDHVALGNAPVTAETDEPDGMKRVDLAETRPLPSYLVAVTVGPFDVVDGGTAGRAAIPVRFVVPRGRGADTRYAREVTPKVIAALEDFFDLPYPYGKLDVSVVPRTWLAMEHPGLVSLSQLITLVPATAETRQRKRDYTSLVAHELAHYWFGDLVTAAWWDDIWLAEGLATWLERRITDEVGPGWHAGDDALEETDAALTTDALASARAIRETVDTRESVLDSLETDTAYGKSAAVLTMFERWLGGDRMRDVARAFVRAHIDGNATSDDFLAALADVAGADAAAAFRSFLAQPGAPLVTMEVRCSGAPTFHLVQRRALSDGASGAAAQTWQLPVCVRTGTGKGPGTRTCALVTAAEADVALPGRCPRWLVADAGGDGYYRAVVTGKVGPPPAAQLHLRERLRLVGEVEAAHQRGDVTIADLLREAATLAADRDPRVALRAVALFRTVPEEAFDDELSARYLRFVDRTLGPRARALGWQRRPGDDDDVQALRAAVVLLVARRDRALGEQAVRLVRRALVDRTAVADELFVVLLQAAAIHGDRALYDQVLAALRASTDRRDRARLLWGLGSFVDPAIAADARALITSPDLDPSEARNILWMQLRRRPTRAAALAWARTYAPAALPHMLALEAADLIGSLAEVPCDPAGRADAETWLTPLTPGVDGGAHALALGLERADRCIAGLARDLPALRTFLARY